MNLRVSTFTFFLCGVLSAATQSIVIEDHKPQKMTIDLTDYLDVNKATISGNAQALSLLQQIKDSPRFYSDKKGALNLTDPNFYCLIHVVVWGAADSLAGKPVQKVTAQNWYLYSSRKGWAQDDFASNKRIFGSKHLFLLYIHVNKSTDVPLVPRYEISVTSKEPANLQHLLAAAAAFLPGAQEGAQPKALAPANYYGLADFNISYSPSDVSVAPYIVETDPKNSNQLLHTSIGDSIVFDNEGTYRWDVSVAVPIRKESQLQINNTNNTVTAQKVDKRNVFAVLDLYPFKKDIKSQSFDLRPYGVVGVAVGSQPLHKILIGAGWGPRYAQFYAGVLLAKQSELATLSAGVSATPAQQSADTRMKYKPQFAFGINLPVREVFQAATSEDFKGIEYQFGERNRRQPMTPGQWLIPAATIAAVIWLGGCNRKEKAERRRQEIVVREFRKLPRLLQLRAESKLKLQGEDLTATLDRFDQDSNYRLSPKLELRTQAVIDQTLIPIPIVNGAFEPLTSLPQIPNDAAPVLTQDKEKQILQAARSVGRLDFYDQGTFKLFGTAFVVGKSNQAALIATNCHVIDDRNITPTRPDRAIGSPIPKTTVFQIYFGDSPVHDNKLSFSIVQVMPCGVTGLDVALLTTKLTSVEGGTPFPNPVPLRATSLSLDPSTQQKELVGIVGYPNLAVASPDDDYTSLFSKFDATRYAKFYSPGAVRQIEPEGGIDYLLHNASTMAGYSGSPLLDLGEMDVIGVHACCGSTGGPLPVTLSFLPCAQKLIAPQVNFSLSSWSARKDAALARTLRLYGSS